MDTSEQFALLFDGNDEFVFLKKEALSGRLKQYDHVHFAAWQALLNVLPTEAEEGSGKSALESWEKKVTEAREEYAKLKSELMVNPHQEGADDADDVTDDNPLSTGESSTWAKYFANSELQKDIFRDVDRTYPEIDFFREQAIQEMMTTILFVYAKQHPEVAYKQGMHEICAVPLYLAHRERIERQSADTYSVEEGKTSHIALVKTLYDPKYIEHDTFILFSKILDHLAPFYIQSKRVAAPPPNSSIDNTLGVSLESSNGSNSDSSSCASSSASSNAGGSAVLRKCKYIQDVLLKKHDEQLSVHLQDIDLEPQLYLLRWIRILFGREFHLEDTVTVWDSIFAFDDRFGFIDQLAVAMLIFIRSQLLSRDFADCIKRLQKYPPVEDVTILIEHAIALTKPRPAGIVGPLPFPSSLPSSSTPSPTPTMPLNAPLVTVSSITSSAGTSSIAARPPPQGAAKTFSSESRNVTVAPPKPIVYASPAYNAQAQIKDAPSSDAQQHHKSKSAGPSLSSMFSNPTPKRAVPNASDAQILKATPLNTPPQHGAHRHAAEFETPMVSVPKAHWEELNRQVADSNTLQAKLGDKLGTVITGLQAALTSPDELNSEQVTELLVLTLAGLKKTRDIALGLLPDDDEELPPMTLTPSKSAPPKQSQTSTSSTTAPIGVANNHSSSTSHSTTSNSSLGGDYSAPKTQPAAPLADYGDFGLLPPADTDEWVFSPNAAAGGPSGVPKSQQSARGASPSPISIPASSDASQAAVSAIFD